MLALPVQGAASSCEQQHRVLHPCLRSWWQSLVTSFLPDRKATSITHGGSNLQTRPWCLAQSCALSSQPCGFVAAVFCAPRLSAGCLQCWQQRASQRQLLQAVLPIKCKLFNHK